MRSISGRIGVVMILASVPLLSLGCSSSSKTAAGAPHASVTGGAGGSSPTDPGGAATLPGGSGGADSSGSSGPAGSGGAGGGAGGPDPHFLIFLLIGQSNMEGKPPPEAQDLVQDERVKVLGYLDNPAQSRKYNEWATAYPPLHSAWGGVGPGDYFAKTIVAALPAQYRIGLVPLGISGVDIDFFRKGVVSARRAEFTIPPDNHWKGAYEWVISRAQLAQQVGVIRGIIFHQGESDTGSDAWLSKVDGMVSDLRTDLGIGEAAPFIAGEMLYSGCCVYHNQFVDLIPTRIKNSYVISTKDLTGIDTVAHFDLTSQRTLGKRYGEQMLTALKLP